MLRTDELNTSRLAHPACVLVDSATHDIGSGKLKIQRNNRQVSSCRWCARRPEDRRQPFEALRLGKPFISARVIWDVLGVYKPK